MEKKTGIFTIEAGRRCSTGEGKFELTVTSNDLIALPNAIDMQVKKRAEPSANISSQLGVSDQKKPKDKSQKSQRNSQPLPLSLQLNEQSQKEHRISLKSQHPSQLTPEFKQELEEHISHPPPPSPSTEKEPKTKDKHRSKGFSLFGNKDKKKSFERKSDGRDGKGDSKQQNGVKGEVNVKTEIQKEEALYDEAVTDAERKLILKGGDNCYEEAEPMRQYAWKNMGQLEEDHEEDYDRIKKAALENKDKGVENLPRVDDDEEDEMYDRVDLNMQEARKKSIQNNSDSAHIYGFSSGKALGEIPDDEDYATPDVIPQGDDHTENDYEYEDDDDPYDDTALNDNTEKTEYTDAISVQQKPPVTSRPVPKRRAPVYEEVQ
ncbi:hypothetical protein FSP39_005207 [Pinctada imbricata]|uniref:Uncharacterized protein n=1 Tax=Pinctada imbricata TaxID=66713 RepID=A0AA88XY43_PINIB|nr:hypothetical protein FSP39_005207 [Pinctada imbricata]